MAKSIVLFAVSLIVVAIANALVVVDAPAWLDLPLTGLGALGYAAATLSFILGLDRAHDAFTMIREALKGK